LTEERDRIDAAITLLSGSATAKPTVKKRGRRKMSAASRARISAALKARWAKAKKAK
jgi:hypothetical protein